MQKSRFFIVISLIAIVLMTISCSEYEKILKSNDADLKYRKAKAYYNKADYARASTIFEQIVYIYRGSAKGDTVYYYLAKSYYAMEDYIMAGNYFKEVVSNYTRSPFAEESDYMQGYCYYKMSPKPSLDQENTDMALSVFDMFLYKHPDSKYVPECKRLIAEMRNKLVEKAYLNSKLYFNLGYYKAAVIALRNCISEYPDNKYREELMFLIVKSSYLLADNSVPEKRKERFQNTLDEYYAFVGEFPESTYKKDLEKIYNGTKQVLGL